MSRILKFTQYLGAFPLKFDPKTSKFLDSRKTRLCSLFTIICFSLAAFAFFLDGLFFTADFADFFYSITDRALLVGIVPLNMFVLWKLRLDLLSTWNTCLNIVQKLDPSFSFSSDFIVYIFIFGIGLTDFIALIPAILYIPEFTKLTIFIMGFSFFYLLLQDMIFMEVYSINTQVFKIMNKNLKSGNFELKKLKTLYFSLLLNTQKMNNVFNFFLFSVLINFFGQLVGCYDFASYELRLDFGNSMLVVTTVVYQLCRFGCLVWIAEQPNFIVRFI